MNKKERESKILDDIKNSKGNLDKIKQILSKNLDVTDDYQMMLQVIKICPRAFFYCGVQLKGNTSKGSDYYCLCEQYKKSLNIDKSKKSLNIDDIMSRAELYDLTRELSEIPKRDKDESILEYFVVNLDLQLQNENLFIHEAIHKNWRCLEYIDNNINDYEQFALFAIEQNAEAFKLVKDLQNENLFIHEAIRKNWRCLEYIDNNINEYKKFALFAIEQNAEAFTLVNLDLQQDSLFIKESINVSHLVFGFFNIEMIKGLPKSEIIQIYEKYEEDGCIDEVFDDDKQVHSKENSAKWRILLKDKYGRFLKFAPKHIKESELYSYIAIINYPEAFSYSLSTSYALAAFAVEEAIENYSILENKYKDKIWFIVGIVLHFDIKLEQINIEDIRNNVIFLRENEKLTNNKKYYPDHGAVNSDSIVYQTDINFQILIDNLKQTYSKSMSKEIS